MSDDFTRLKTGITGLDDMIEGGLPFPSTILLAGGTGTGKTTFCLQFLMEGAKKGEKGLFFTALSEPAQWMLRFASRYSFIDKAAFGKDIEYVDLAQFLSPKDFSAERQESLLELIDSKIMEHMPQRIVIDPITVVGQFFSINYRQFLYDLSARLKNWQSVTILTGESHPNEVYPLEVAYTADGVIILYYIEVEDGRRRYIEVLKMRGTNHLGGKHALDLSKSGMSVQAGLK